MKLMGVLVLILHRLKIRPSKTITAGSPKMEVCKNAFLQKGVIFSFYICKFAGEYIMGFSINLNSNGVFHLPRGFPVVGKTVVVAPSIWKKSARFRRQMRSPPRGV